MNINEVLRTLEADIECNICPVQTRKNATQRHKVAFREPYETKIQTQVHLVPDLGFYHYPFFETTFKSFMYVNAPFYEGKHH